MVERPLTFDLEDLKRFPSVTRVHFIECAGNGRNAYRTPKPDMTPQQVDGLTSNTEWTGVPLSLLFREAGVKPKATWFLAEGGDAAVLSRSIPVTKALDDALLVWGQNGEPLRVQNGYPVRLLLPGWEGNACVKWLRRLELIDQPNMSRDETSKYTDPLPGGKARQFSFEMDAKSVITSPVAPAKLSRAGWWPVRGLAWSGRGRITRVEVSTDGGKTWADAELQGPVQPKAHVRFQHMWNWDGKPAVLLSRATDETGAVQPTRAGVRGGPRHRHRLPLQLHPRLARGSRRRGDVRGGRMSSAARARRGALAGRRCWRCSAAAVTARRRAGRRRAVDAAPAARSRPPRAPVALPASFKLGRAAVGGRDHGVGHRREPDGRHAAQGPRHVRRRAEAVRREVRRLPRRQGRGHAAASTRC